MKQNRQLSTTPPLCHLCNLTPALNLRTPTTVGFSQELSTKTGKLDSDPHLWMPLSLGEEEYVELMVQKDVGAEESRAHYKRMKNMMSSFEMGSKVC